MTELKEYDILSPEGVEERVKLEMTYLVTLTQGGKYRLYYTKNGERIAGGVHDTIEGAYEAIGMRMGVIGALLNDPKGTIEMMMKSLGKKE